MISKDVWASVEHKDLMAIARRTRLEAVYSYGVALHGVFAFCRLSASPEKEKRPLPKKRRTERPPNVSPASASSPPPGC